VSSFQSWEGVGKGVAKQPSAWGLSRSNDCSERRVPKSQVGGSNPPGGTNKVVVSREYVHDDRSGNEPSHLFRRPCLTVFGKAGGRRAPGGRCLTARRRHSYLAVEAPPAPEPPYDATITVPTDIPGAGRVRSTARVVLGGALIAAGLGHLTFARHSFQAQLPDWVRIDKNVVVILSGLVEIALGSALIVARP
jgi:hypothetical protein